MPKVVQYEGNQVLTDVVSQPRASGNVPAGAFAGGSIIGGLAGIAQAGAQMKHRIDTTSAEESLVQFERDKNSIFFNPENGYFNSQGRNAFDDADAAIKSLGDLKKKYGKSLSQNSKTMFNKAADAHITRGQADIARHASKGLRSWEIATIKSQVENTVENATLYWNQPDQLAVQNALGRRAVIDAAEMEGIGAEATAERLQTYDSSFVRAAVSAATQNSATEGLRLFEQQEGRLEGPDKLNLEKDIIVKAKAEKTQSDAQQAVIIGTGLVDRLDDREAIREAVNTIEDSELRKKAMTESMRQFNLKKRGESEARADAFERAESHVVNGGSAETYKVEDPEGWGKLSTKQQRSIESGKAVITDWNVFSELMIMSKDKLSKVDPVDHFDHLAPAERSKLISAVKNANGTGGSSDRVDHQEGRTRSAQTTAAIEQMLGNKRNWNDKKREQANVFYSLLDDEVAFRESQKEDKLTSEEYTDVLSDLTRKVTIEKSFIFDFLAPDEELSSTDIPADDLRILSKFLRNKGIPVTSENLIKAQRQANTRRPADNGQLTDGT